MAIMTRILLGKILPDPSHVSVQCTGLFLSYSTRNFDETGTYRHHHQHNFQYRQRFFYQIGAEISLLHCIREELNETKN
jgi:hypothetical protein